MGVEDRLSPVAFRFAQTFQILENWCAVFNADFVSNGGEVENRTSNRPVQVEQHRSN